MDRMLVVIFENETKVIDGMKALRELDLHGSITVYSHAVVMRNPDCTTIVRQSDDRGPFGLLVGAVLGGLIGLLGGPAGPAIGFTLGSVGGAAVDLNKARVGEDFVVEVAVSLLPNRAAIVAEIEEDLTEPVDSRMGALGGTTFRRGITEVKHTIHDEHIAAIEADLPQMKAELATVHADRKAKLQEKINQLDSRIQAQLQKTKQRREAAEREDRAKVEFLQAKAAAAKAKAAETHIKP